MWGVRGIGVPGGGYDIVPKHFTDGGLAGAVIFDVTQRVDYTFSLRNMSGRVYVGRTSVYGDP